MGASGGLLSGCPNVHGSQWRTEAASAALQHDKPKPWDVEGTDHWSIQPFTKDDNPAGLLEESSFAILFPKYRGERSAGKLLKDCPNVAARVAPVDITGQKSCAQW